MREGVVSQYSVMGLLATGHALAIDGGAGVA
jgi:hypothetical protein